MDEQASNNYLLVSYVSISQADRGLSRRRFKKLLKIVKVAARKQTYDNAVESPGFIAKTENTMVLSGGGDSYLIEYELRTGHKTKRASNPTGEWILNHLRWKEFDIWFCLNGSVAVTKIDEPDQMVIARKDFLQEFSIGKRTGFWNHSRNVAMFNELVYYVDKDYSLKRVPVADLCRLLVVSKDHPKDEIVAKGISDFCITPKGELYLLHRDGLLSKHDSDKCQTLLTKQDEPGFFTASLTSNDWEFFASTFNPLTFGIRIHLLSWRLKLMDTFAYNGKSEGEFPIVMKAFKLPRPGRLRILVVCRHFTFVDVLAIFNYKLYPIKLEVYVSENWLYGLEWNQHTHEIVIPQPGINYSLKIVF